MILVSVQNPGDVQLTRALLQALGKRFEWFVLFADPELKQRMGDIDCKYGFDAPFCLLNAANFHAVVSFAGLLHPGMMRNILLLSFFNEIGIPTFEVQHGLFQYGINNVDTGPQVGSDLGRGDQLSLEIGYAARNVLRWGGPEGIGYPKSLLTPRRVERSGDFVLITSNNHWQIYQAQHRREFGVAVSNLAQSRSDLQFVWKPHFAEDLVPETRQALAAIEALKLPNLRIERSGDAEDLIANCAFGVSTVSTTLLDFQVQGKPVLVYQAAPVRHLIERLQAATFRDAQELQERVAQLQADPARHRICTEVEPFAPERLARRFESAIAAATPARDYLPVTLKYLDHLRAQTPTAQPADITRAAAQLAQDVARLTGSLSQEVTKVEGTLTRAVLGVAGEIKQETADVAASLSQALQGTAGELRRELARGAKKLSQEMANVVSGTQQTSRKLTDFQRSTLAYKLKKVFKGTPKS